MPIAGVLAGFVVGGLSIVLVQGGIGVYPMAVSQVLMLYGVTQAMEWRWVGSFGLVKP